MISGKSIFIIYLNIPLGGILLYGTLGLLWLNFLWELYLSLRQHHMYRTATQIPSELRDTINAEMYEETRSYFVDKMRFSMFKELYLTLLETLVIWFGSILFVWTTSGVVLKTFGYEPSEMLQSALFVLISNTLYFAVNIPVNFYDYFVFRAKHGLNDQTVESYVVGEFYNFMSLQITWLPISLVAVYVVKAAGDSYFLYLCLLVMAISFFWFAVYPDWIAPLFEKYTPLPDGELKTRIEQLATSDGCPLYKTYTVDGSTHSAHSNVYFYGFKMKNIVLFDTLLKDHSATTSKSDEGKGYDSDEVVALVAHELGHWKLNHSLITMAVTKVSLLLQYLVFFILFKHEPLYRSFGFENEKPVLIGLLIFLQIIFVPYKYLLGFFLTWLNRRFEFQADAHAKRLGKAVHLRRALINLHQHSISFIFPVDDWLYSAWHDSYPPLLERLKVLDKTD